MIVKTSIIQKLPNGKYRLYSRKKDPKTHKRRDLGTYDSLDAVKKREIQVQYFKHRDDDSDDGLADDKHTKMVVDLSDIATYLEEAGFIDKANLCYDIMAAMDGSLEQNLADHFQIPDDQLNIENQGFGGGESPIGGGYGMLGVDEAMRAEDGIEQDNVDVATINGLIGSTPIDRGNFSGLSDAYFYRPVGSIEDNM